MLPFVNAASFRRRIFYCKFEILDYTVIFVVKFRVILDPPFYKHSVQMFRYVGMEKQGSAATNLR